MRRGGRLVSERAIAERRELLAGLRANGVEYVERDGQTFRLPGALAPLERDDDERAPVRIRRERGFAHI
jgi:hypothetical protein